MQPIQQAFEPVSICFASDDNYAPYLKVAIYSLLCNRNRERSYDIIILHKRISREHQGEILGLADGKSGVSIRFVNVVEADRELQSDVGCYYAVETNYRLLLFSKLFQNYRRMLYLDCDIIVTGDVGELFDVDLEGKSAAGVEDVGFRWLAYTKRAIFLDNKPYNVLNYCTDVLGIKDPGGYVNAGVLLFDLEKCRQKVSFRDVVETLHSRNFFYNDQDVLNILLEGNIKQVDCKWNYMNNIAFYLECDRKEFRELYLDLRREDYRIIHYISAKKPWNGEVPMGEVWQKYADE
ncbi:glycosyltransferase family 8 protein [Lachnospiraceae bacterium CLA-AA-H185]|jgi:lipopolysaccharide biosynthesis glycosyltransferase|uniref:Glycosyltransferase family 8 protein n=1 Tax=Maccoyibacter intestinihominis TaxID=3133499 RepID=A0ABV1H9E3_9FIRM